MGTLLHFDGASWEVTTAPVVRTLYSVWASSPEDVWVVGGQGTVLRFDGLEWEIVPAGTSQPLHAVAGSSADDVWVVGGAGVVRRFDGEGWSNADPDSVLGGSLHALAVTGPDAVWAFNENGAGFRWDGAAWARQSTGVRSIWRGAWSPAEDAVLVVGDDGHIQYWDDDRRFDESPGPRANWLAITGSDVHQAWAVGDAVLRRSPLGWTEFEVEGRHALYGAWSGADGRTYAVGTAGALLGIENHEAFSVALDTSYWLRDVWTDGDSSGWIVGMDGVILEYRNPTTWTPYFESVAEENLLSVWGADADHVWAVGEAGTLLEFDGGEWGHAPPPVGGVPVALRGVHGTSADDVWAVGTLGTILHWDGSAWDEVESGDSFSLNDVWAVSTERAWAVGTGGVVLAWDGSDWQPEASGTEVALSGVWADGAGTVWAVGENGVLIGRIY
jgi:hypothetical protein